MQTLFEFIIYNPEIYSSIGTLLIAILSLYFSKNKLKQFFSKTEKIGETLDEQSEQAQKELENNE